MDLTHKLLGGNSPYIQSLTYDLTKREVLVALLNSADSSNASLIVRFPAFTAFREDLEEIDDRLIDSTIGINLLSAGQVCIKTEIREIIISMDGVPHADKVT